MHLGRSGSTHSLQSESNVISLRQMLEVNDDCFIHYYIQQQNTSIGDILVFPCTGVDTMADGWQLTEGGSNVRRSCQSTIVGAACIEQCHSDRNLKTAWFEKRDFNIGIKKKKKNTGWIFIIIGWMCIHTSNTHLCSNNLKSEFCIRWPL